MRKLDRIIQETEDLIKNHDDYEFPEFIAKLREVLGISRVKMAKELGMHHSAIFQYEKGFIYSKFQEKHVRFIAKYFGVDCEMLLKKADEFAESRQRKKKE